MLVAGVSYQRGDVIVLVSLLSLILVTVRGGVWGGGVCGQSERFVSIVISKPSAPELVVVCVKIFFS